MNSEEQRYEQLRKRIQFAIDEIERGEGIELTNDDELREFFEDIKARGRQRLAAEQRSQR